MTPLTSKINPLFSKKKPPVAVVTRTSHRVHYPNGFSELEHPLKHIPPGQRVPRKGFWAWLKRLVNYGW